MSLEATRTRRTRSVLVKYTLFLLVLLRGFLIGT